MAKLAFSHYFTQFNLSNNKPAAQDYYQTQWLTPTGENNKHVAYGGYLRDRPLPRDPYAAGVDYALEDMKTEVRQAIEAGLDGFTLDLLSVTRTNHWVAQERLLTAANAVDPSFLIMLMPDMTMMQTMTYKDFAARITVLAQYPSAFHINGAIVISPFAAEKWTPAKWTSAIAEITKQSGKKVFFVPCFLNYSASVQGFASISQGFSEWGLGNPAATTQRAGYGADAHTRGKVWMQPVRVQDTRPNQAMYDEAGNTENLRTSWKAAIDTNAEWVQIVTWNDYSENAQIAPSMSHGWSFLDLSRYYLNWWKSGTPSVLRDQLFLTHRTHLSTVKTFLHQTKLMALRQGSTPTRDNVELVVLATASGTAMIVQNNGSKSFPVVPGLNVFTTPLSPGLVSGSLLTSTTQVLQLTSPFIAVDKPDVQNMNYVGSSVTR
jgi:hypothetical protein